MIRTKGEAGTGDVVEAVRHIRTLHKENHFTLASSCITLRAKFTN